MVYVLKVVHTGHSVSLTKKLAMETERRHREVVLGVYVLVCWPVTDLQGSCIVSCTVLSKMNH